MQKFHILVNFARIAGMPIEYGSNAINYIWN